MSSLSKNRIRPWWSDNERMSSRRTGVYFIRFAELANACGFLYLAWAINATDLAGPRSRTQVGLTDCVLLLAIAPFFVALITTFQTDLTRSQWLLIRATHQALVIVTIPSR